MKEEKCYCCKKIKARRNGDCVFCYKNCPSHRGWCDKNIIKSGVFHKLVKRTFLGTGKALCLNKKIHPNNAEWEWKYVTCKNCLKKRKEGRG